MWNDCPTEGGPESILQLLIRQAQHLLRNLLGVRRNQGRRIEAGCLLVEVQLLAVECQAVGHQEEERLLTGRLKVGGHHQIPPLPRLIRNGRAIQRAKSNVRHVHLTRVHLRLGDEHIGRIAQLNIVNYPSILPRREDSHVESFDRDVLDHARATTDLVVHIDANASVCCSSILDIRCTDTDQPRVLERHAFVVVHQHSVSRAPDG